MIVCAFRKKIASALAWLLRRFNGSFIAGHCAPSAVSLQPASIFR
jgi:hypothetical protein